MYEGLLAFSEGEEVSASRELVWHSVSGVERAKTPFYHGQIDPLGFVVSLDHSGRETGHFHVFEPDQRRKTLVLDGALDDKDVEKVRATYTQRYGAITAEIVGWLLTTFYLDPSRGIATTLSEDDQRKRQFYVYREAGSTGRLCLEYRGGLHEVEPYENPATRKCENRKVKDLCEFFCHMFIMEKKEIFSLLISRWQV